MQPQAARILIAGVGNVLHGDDGFGVALANRLCDEPGLPLGVTVIETGIGGMGLVQEAMRDCAALLILDAFERGGTPGELYLLEPELTDFSGLDVHQRRDYFADTHCATPLRVLNVLAGIARLPAIVNVLGCEPARHDALEIGLSPAVAAAIEPAVQRVRDWIDARASSTRRLDRQAPAV
ncbi:MAG: hydrogenase maturation protease [Pseudomonadota bacterium]|nr:hydrogenase maturation protease [Pseudomonadota bacterium]